MYCSNPEPGNPAAAPYPTPLTEDHGHGVDPRGLDTTHRIFAGHSDSICPGGHLGQLKINSTFAIEIKSISTSERGIIPVVHKMVTQKMLLKVIRKFF